jgi:3-oxoacyl-(acyl-carrier-protein) synthase
MRRVVITGLGILAPGAHGLQAFEDLLREGRSAVRFRPDMAALNFGCHVAAVPEDLTGLKDRYFGTASQSGMDRHAVIGCIAGIDCWRDAGLPEPSAGTVDWETSVCFGSGVGALDTIGKMLVPMTDAGRSRRLGSVIPERIMCSAASARLAGILGAGGQVTANSSACNSGTEAIVNAYWMVREGRAARVLAGSCESDSEYIWSGFDAMRVLSRNFNAEPERASRPLSATACGFVPAAGAGALLVESLESARARGARIYAEVAGGAVNCGAQRNGGSMTMGNPEAARRVIRAALCDARMEPAAIDLISGHFTGTIADPLEMRNWRCAMGLPEDRFPFVNAPKSLFGHALGASGAIECVAAVLQLERGFIHPSRNCEDLHPHIEWAETHIPARALDRRLKAVAKASFGFGDVNSCIVFTQPES